MTTSRRAALAAPLFAGVFAALWSGATNAAATGASPATGVEVTIDTLGEVVAGTRTSIDVSVRNTGPATLCWQAGGCAVPVEVIIRPVDAPVDQYSDRLMSMDPIWDGDPASLSDAIAASGAAARAAWPARHWHRLGVVDM